MSSFLCIIFSVFPYYLILFLNKRHLQFDSGFTYIFLFVIKKEEYYQEKNRVKNGLHSTYFQNILSFVFQENKYILYKKICHLWQRNKIDYLKKILSIYLQYNLTLFQLLFSIYSTCIIYQLLFSMLQENIHFN